MRSSSGCVAVRSRIESNNAALVGMILLCPSPNTTSAALVAHQPELRRPYNSERHGTGKEDDVVPGCLFHIAKRQASPKYRSLFLTLYTIPISLALRS